MKKSFYKKVKTLKDIEEQGFVLTPGRYVGIEEKEDDGETYDEKMTRLCKELKGIFEDSNNAELNIKKQLKGIGYDIDKI